MITKDIRPSASSPISFVTGFSSSLTFVIGTLGRYGSGKSRFQVTGPDITGIIPLDQKTRRTVENTMKELGKTFGKNILMPPVDFIQEPNPIQTARMDTEASKEFYRNRVERIKDYLLNLHANPDVRLICLDTATQARIRSRGSLRD